MTDRIAEAARATRMWQYTPGNVVYSLSVDGVHVCTTQAEAKDKCDRLNAEAFLLAVREPSEAMVEAVCSDEWIGHPEAKTESIVRWKLSQRSAARKKWRAMIDALIAEVK